jgi:hypothetical protein
LPTPGRPVLFANHVEHRVAVDDHLREAVGRAYESQPQPSTNNAQAPGNRAAFRLTGAAIACWRRTRGFRAGHPQSDPITFTIAMAIMLVLGIRLWFKLASNLVHVMVAIVWSPVAMFCGLIPEASWVSSLWIREFSGRLAGAVLATIASALGFAMALSNPGVLAFVGVGAAFLAAHDLVDWLARTPGTSMGGVVGAGLRMGVGLVGGGGAVSAGAQAAAMRSYNASQAANATNAFYSYD